MKFPRITARGAWCAAASLMTLLWAGAAWTQVLGDYELYILDMKSGEVTRVTDMPDYGLFNASFSHNGKMLYHDAVIFDPNIGFNISYLATTELETGETTVNTNVIVNNPKESPNGQQVVYDTFFNLPYPDWNIYLLPVEGGDRQLLRAFGGSPQWNNNSKRIAFADVGFVDSYPDWGYMATIDLEGNEIRLDTVGAYGCGLDYSPDGKLIVYQQGDPVTFGGCFWPEPAPLMAVPVNQHGEPLGDPYAITDGMYFDNWPSISNDGKYVVFNSNRSTTGRVPDEQDLWIVPMDGSGQPTKLYGLDYVDELDASFSRNGRYIVFSSNRDAVMP